MGTSSRVLMFLILKTRIANDLTSERFPSLSLTSCRCCEHLVTPFFAKSKIKTPRAKVATVKVFIFPCEFSVFGSKYQNSKSKFLESIYGTRLNK